MQGCSHAYIYIDTGRHGCMDDWIPGCMDVIISLSRNV